MEGPQDGATGGATVLSAHLAPLSPVSLEETTLFFRQKHETHAVVDAVWAFVVHVTSSVQWFAHFAQDAICHRRSHQELLLLRGS